jgi:predicted TIM-barrel fold metal-dependent hydrolase
MTKNELRRRDILGIMLAGGALGATRLAESSEVAKPSPKALPWKITLEEHFSFPGSVATTFQPPGLSPEVWKRIEARLFDVHEERLPEMDANGVQMQIVSLNANGIQGEPDRQRAIDMAKAANDWLGEKFVVPHPTRFAGFAAVAMQDPLEAAREAERAITQLGFKGVLVNGYSPAGDENRAEYLDSPRCFPFWERVEALNVPVYLHPRSPLPSQRLIYEDHDEMMGPMWAFGAETAAHALRLITSGLFDRFPRQQLILGHLGEGLVAMMARAQRRFEYGPCGKVLKKPLTQYMRDNFYITTSGNFHTATLKNVIEELGTERVMFSVDYPYESMSEGAAWFDACPLSSDDRKKIGAANARRLLKIAV